MNRALIVMAKKPWPGETKTRLSPPLTPKDAAALYRCLLLDTLELMSRLQSTRGVVAYAPTHAQQYFQEIVPDGFELVPQLGLNLGERLDNVLRRCLERGYGQAVVMNSDGPTLPADYLLRAFRCLDDGDVDVVLGPSDDGGYYLIGLKQPCSALFDIVMSTSTVFQETMERARRQGLRVTCLPPWYDVDTPEELRRLATEVSSLPDEVASNTRRFLLNWEG